MVERLVILAAKAAPDDLQTRLTALHGRVVQRFGAQVWIVEMPDDEVDDDTIRAWPGVMDVFDGAAPTDLADDETARLGIAGWNLRHTAAFRTTRVERRYEGRSWGDERVEPEG